MKPTLPQGTRDFNAETVKKRTYIFDTIQKVFELYGFQPLETPAMENLETLTGKYGDEGDKLIFKILNNGLDNPSKHEQSRQGLETILTGKNSKQLTERALRYDLTIPFARYVAMNYGLLTFPFKRYQMQPVWRADRPQRGRYREFYQCDADIVGSNSLLNEIEFIRMYAEVFNQLGIEVEIRLNNRKVLVALAEMCGGKENLVPVTVAIDKLDKIGMDGVKKELASRNISETHITSIEKFLQITGSNSEKLDALKSLFDTSVDGVKGLDELNYLLTFPGIPANVMIDLTLARGLNYYTGTIFEIRAKNIQMGSIGGGGRYDDLTGLFGVPNVPGVGISFGVDRIFDVMEELDLFPASAQQTTRVLFFNLGEKESRAAYNIMQQLRQNNISCELFHEQEKFAKQFKYAEKKNIPFVVIIGSAELAENTCTVKNIISGEQQSVSLAELSTFLA